MKIGKSDMEHMSDVMLQIFNRLSTRFIVYENKNEDTENTINYLTKLSGSIGYMAQINGGIHKSFRQEKRIKILENKIKNIPINTTMFEEAPLEKFR